MLYRRKYLVKNLKFGYRMANPVILSLMDWIRGVGGSKSTYLSLMTLFCVNLLLFFVRASSGAANLKKNDDFPKSTRSLPPLLKHFFAPTKRDLMPTTSDQKGVIRRLLRKLHFALRVSFQTACKPSNHFIPLKIHKVSYIYWIEQNLC